MFGSHYVCVHTRKYLSTLHSILVLPFFYLLFSKKYLEFLE